MCVCGGVMVYSFPQSLLRCSRVHDTAHKTADKGEFRTAGGGRPVDYKRPPPGINLSSKPHYDQRLRLKPMQESEAFPAHLKEMDVTLFDDGGSTSWLLSLDPQLFAAR